MIKTFLPQSINCRPRTTIREERVEQIRQIIVILLFILWSNSVNFNSNWHQSQKNKTEKETVNSTFRLKEAERSCSSVSQSDAYVAGCYVLKQHQNYYSYRHSAPNHHQKTLWVSAWNAPLVLENRVADPFSIFMDPDPACSKQFWICRILRFRILILFYFCITLHYIELLNRQ